MVWKNNDPEIYYEQYIEIIDNLFIYLEYQTARRCWETRERVRRGTSEMLRRSEKESYRSRKEEAGERAKETTQSGEARARTARKNHTQY